MYVTWKIKQNNQICKIEICHHVFRWSTEQTIDVLKSEGWQNYDKKAPIHQFEMVAWNERVITAIISMWLEGIDNNFIKFNGLQIP